MPTQWKESNFYVSMIKTSSTSKWVTLNDNLWTICEALLLFPTKIEAIKQCQTRGMFLLMASIPVYHVLNIVIISLQTCRCKKKCDKMTGLFWFIFLLVNMFSLEINFIRKELREATVISRRTQMIKRAAIRYTASLKWIMPNYSYG